MRKVENRLRQMDDRASGDCWCQTLQLFKFNRVSKTTEHCYKMFKSHYNSSVHSWLFAASYYAPPPRGCI